MAVNHTNFVGGTIKPQRRFSMKKGKFFVMGMLAVLLALGLVLAGCDNGTSPDDEGTSLDNALVAKWYIYPTQVDDPDAEPAFEITASGRLIGSAVNQNAEINITTSGRTIKSTTTFNGDTAESGTATYSVTGNRLLLSNPMLNGVTGGLFQSFVSAIQFAQSIGGALGADGHYHKGETGGTP
jgi:hypothetical protein